MSDILISLMPAEPETRHPESFTPRAETYFDAMQGVPDEINTLFQRIGASRMARLSGAAKSAANFRGRWGSLTGSTTAYTSVYHKGVFWWVENPVADVTLEEPTVSEIWRPILPGETVGFLLKNQLFGDPGLVAPNYFEGICWSPELALFCAVANDGEAGAPVVVTSPDGMNWTAQTTLPALKWRSVCWSPELTLFCAVASSGIGNRVMTSPDGINWTARTSAADNNWRSVCWSPELTLFCAVAYSGTGNRVMTSPDGINWTARASAADNNWLSVCWSPELALFCAVASSGTGNRVMTSPEGINWTARASAADDDWTSVCWSPELALFCAVASSGTGNRVMTSPDGINWAVGGKLEATLKDIAWSPELGVFFVVSTREVFYSYDARVWLSGLIEDQTVYQTMLRVCWSPKLAVFCITSAYLDGVHPRFGITLKYR